VHSTRILLVTALLATSAPQAAPQGQTGERQIPLQPVPVTQLDLRQGRGELDGARLSMTFAEPTPIEDILLRLVRDTQLSLVPDPALEQRFVGDLKNVTIREALDVMLGPLGLDYLVDAQVIRVFRRELETRFYGIDYVIVERAGRRSGDAPDLYAELAQGVRTLLSAEGRMNVDRIAALLQVTDTPARHARISQYLETVMLRVTRQVQIDAHVIEVELVDASAPGIDWDAVRRRLGDTVRTSEPAGAPSISGSALALNAGGATALLDALAAQGTVNVLSRPRVVAMNNAPVLVRTGTSDVVRVAATPMDLPSGLAGRVAPGPRPLSDGFELRVTSQISADGIVHMRVSPSVTGPASAGGHSPGHLRSAVTVREAQTLARVRQGETVVITGLTRDWADTEVSQRRGIGRVPLLGQLFRRTDTTRRRADLVILLTPTVVSLGRPVATTARRNQTAIDAPDVAAVTR
jgi:type II secretory pathway component HofQ